MSLFTKRRKSLSMKQEDKELLLRDICGRLPYHPILNWKFIDNTSKDEELKELSDLYIWWITKAQDCEVKPYLRPMSSMTKDEQEEFFNLIICVDNGKAVIEEDKIDAYNNFIYSHHLDNKNFIEMGLAIKAPEGMYLY